MQPNWSSPLTIFCFHTYMYADQIALLCLIFQVVLENPRRILDHLLENYICYTFQGTISFIEVRDAFKKKNCPEGDIGTYRREGGKKYPLFLLHQKGDISLWREGSKCFCPMSHVHFCVSVSTQFVALYSMPIRKVCKTKYQP